MDYEKKYKEAIKEAAASYKDEDRHLKATLERIFPELKEESEDERIRKEILDYIDKSTGCKRWVVWLEKQGEQEEPQVYETEDGEIITYSETDGYKVVEPKFKVGDFVVDNCGYTWKIEGILNQFYILEGVEGGESRPTIEWVDKTCHLWTIEDARDGDVLFGSEWGVILMFRGIGNTEWDDVIDYHCYYDCYRKDFIVQENVEYWGNTKNNQLKPATKEQRELLFQKMKEVGYMWDDEKKEPKKIEQKPTWSEEDERLCSCLIEEQEESLDNVRNDKYGHSEIISDLKEMYNERIDWLKSLKQRMKGE